MLVFAHTHKCAGTSILNLCKRTEAIHFVNGAARSAGMPRVFVATRELESSAEFRRKFRPKRLKVLIDKYEAAGANFLAVEWGLPAFYALPTGAVQMFTVLRDPLSRYMSNYSFDLERGYSTARTIDEYRAQGGAFRMFDYYTRFFGGMANLDRSPVTAEVIERSYRALRSFDAVLIQERPETFRQLERFGLDPDGLQRRNATKAKQEVPEDFRERFLADAQLDYALYSEAVRIAEGAMGTGTPVRRR